MANYAEKLTNMRNRRLGLEGVSMEALSRTASSATFSQPMSLKEAYEKRTSSDATKYALGAMQQLEPEATKVSLDEAERVKNQLNTGLNAAGIPASYELQGSVPLNIHIRFSSDIDMLVLHGGFVTYDATGPRSNTYHGVAETPLGYIRRLRTSCEEILTNEFPAAKVDTSGAKSISLSGGSLRRKVDVVPSHWHDTAAYQQTKAKHDREVRVLDKHTNVFIPNSPFLHMKCVEEKDIRTAGGAKKLIRFLKNLKRDANKTIKLTSYDIASLVWHVDDGSLIKPYYMELSLIAEAQQFLQTLIDNPWCTYNLDTPDKSRKIVDTSDKYDSISLLKAEVDQVAADIAKELRPLYVTDRESILKSLREATIL